MSFDKYCLFPEDEDECSSGNPCGDPAMTHTMCQNTEGGFACVCVPGYTPNNISGVCDGK